MSDTGFMDGLVVALLPLLFLVQGLLGGELDSVRSVPPSEVEVTYAPYDPQVARALAFGHWPAAVDWLWIRALIDPVTQKVGPGKRANIYFGLDLATQLDPAFFDLYVAGGQLLAVVRGDAAGAMDLLLKGNDFRRKKLPFYPSTFVSQEWGASWRIPLLMAYVYLFELNDMPHAAQAFKEAASIARSPQYLQKLAQRFEKPGGEYEVGLRLLNFMIEGEKDQRLLDQLKEKRKALYLAQYLFQLNESFQTFLVSRPHYKEGPLKRYFDEFVKESRTPIQEPLGGVLSLNGSGKIVTSTPHQKVFGLE
ncbi:hypothetical protein WDW37_16830 [Bdellovibrionota bacterium FG-1]